jgi:hypothetical protein
MHITQHSFAIVFTLKMLRASLNESLGESVVMMMGSLWSEFCKALHAKLESWRGH